MRVCACAYVCAYMYKGMRLGQPFARLLVLRQECAFASSDILNNNNVKGHPGEMSSLEDQAGQMCL